MSSELQTVLALVLVALAVGWLVRQALVKRKKPGCGSDCGCAAEKFKSSLKQ